MHYLTFGTVVTINEFDDSMLLMIVDWNCTDEEGNNWDYIAVPEVLGWTLIESEGEELSLSDYTDAVFFNHEEIEKIFFVGPPNEGNLELEQEAYKNAEENDLPIAKYYSENDAKELEISFEGIDRDKPYVQPSGNNDSKRYLPIGTVVAVDVSDDDADSVDLLNVMIVAVKPYQLANDFDVGNGKDYRVMPWDTGYLSTEAPLCINNEDILHVVSLGYVNSNVQLALQSEIVSNENLWNEVLSSEQ